jgi:acyl carrier protein
MNATATHALTDRFVTQLSELLELADASDVKPDVSLVNLGLDSVKAAEICALLEDEYDVVIPIETFAQNLKVGDLLRLLNP